MHSITGYDYTHETAESKLAGCYYAFVDYFRRLHAPKEHRVTYLNPDMVTGVRWADIPVWATGADRSGYGRKIRSPWEIRINKRWHRIYVICYSNSGSAYVLIKGKEHYLSSWEPRDWFVSSNLPVGV